MTNLIEKNGKFYQECEVVMLSHNNIDTLLTLYKTASGKPLHLSTNLDIISHHTNQHLYIISDDEIKEGDWIYNNKENIVEKITSKTQLIFVLEENKENQTFKKIVATTDNSLEIKNELWSAYQGRYEADKLPQPSQQFIKKYIEEYNKGNIITDVLVEYIFNDFKFMTTLCTTKEKDYILNINPKDNTITIKPYKKKDSWTREEVFNLIKTFSSWKTREFTSEDKKFVDSLL